MATGASLCRRSRAARDPHVLLGRAGASLYSWHSARIYLACALFAAGATRPQIQALCRWQSEDSLRVYARLNAERYDSLLSSAATASVH